jgi:hypothetical protein
MSNYTKATNFTAKDSLPSGDSNKLVKGTEIDTELTAVASAISSKADINSPTFTGTPSAPTAAAGTNTTQLATTAFATAAATAAFPSGGIIMWSGSIASIPSGWYLCNGSNGTPDLRDKFVVGAGSAYAVAATGGSANAIVVAHTHSFSASATTDSASLTGSLQKISETWYNGGVATGVFSKGGNYTDNASPASTDTSNVGSINFDASHTHSVSVSGTTGSTGSSGTNANLPPYYALAYIMKA